MNDNRYRLLFSAIRGTWMAVPEIARGRGAAACAPEVSRAEAPPWPVRASVVLLAAAGCLMLSAPTGAQSALPKGTLPVPGANFVASGSATASTSGANLTINQTTPKAILNWNSFNISSDAAVRFAQPSAAAAALNRIHDANPSIIQGRLTANGQIYLINQNGIIFAKGAQVDANTLVASTLSISDQRFLNGLLSDGAPLEAAVPNGFVRVDEGATLTSAREGRIMLLAPEVSNQGVIEAKDGQIILAAGTKVYLSASQSPALRGLLVEVDGSGTSANLDLGHLIVERGNATLAGLAVNQSGRISATTSVVLNGSVRLLARNTTESGPVTLGKDSRIEILPDSTSSATIQQGQSFIPSSVEIYGKTVEFKQNAAVKVPGGSVSITAQKSLSSTDQRQDDVRVYMAEGSQIDVSGLRDVAVPMERNSLKVELRGDELKDAPLQRTSFLRGKTVYVDARVGTPLADVSAYEAQIPRTVQEKLAVGGSVTIRSEGDFVMRDGARIDISGGSLRYADGYVRTTQLISQGHVVDIGQAQPDAFYDGFADTFVVSSAKWGVSQTFEPIWPGSFYAGYTQGTDAGSVDLVAHAVVLDGSIVGRTVNGPLQREVGTLPNGGQLVLGNPDGGDPSLRDYWLQSVRFESAPPKLDADFSFAASGALTPLPAERSEVTYVPTAYFTDGGLTRVKIVANDKVTVPDSAAVSMRPGGSLAVTSREIDVAGNIVTPGGSITLTTGQTAAFRNLASDYDIWVGPGVRLSTAGIWTNDAIQPGGTPLSPIVLSGGTVKLSSLSDLTLAQGSLADVSGGGWVDAGGKLKGGSGGSIELAIGRFRADPQALSPSVLKVDGELRGYGIAAGGSLTIRASGIDFGDFGGHPGNDPRRFEVTPFFLRRGGFREYDFTGIDGITVQADVELAPVVESLLLRPTYVVAPTGTDLRAISDPYLPALEELRAPATITLSASSSQFGKVEVGENALIRVDPGGAINLEAMRQLTVQGTLMARGGSISLSSPEPVQADEQFFGDQSIWLGKTSALIAAGDSQVVKQANGTLSGAILDGGSVVVDAGRGYVVMEKGALIDVSGSSGVVDIIAQRGAGFGIDRRSVGSAGGSITISAREGMLLDGTLSAAGKLGARGGELALQLVGYRAELLRQDAGDFPDGVRQFVLSASGESIPGGLRPGDVIDPNAVDSSNSTLNGRAFVGADRLAGSGLESILLRGPDRDNEYGVLEVKGDVALTLARSIVIDVPTIRAAGQAELRLAASRVVIANRSEGLQELQPVSQGDGILIVQDGIDALGRAVQVQQIDLAGNVALSGFREVQLATSGDIQGIGVLQGPFERRLAGSLRTGANLMLSAAQIYPATLSEFDLDTTVDPAAPGGSIVIARTTSAPRPVLSAGGTLSLKAGSIVQGGTLKAPFGSIVLNADDEVRLLRGSVTSVSGAIGGPGGAVAIPFGTTEQNQRDYVYTLDSTRKLILSAPPEKRVAIQAPTVAIEDAESVMVNGVPVEKTPAARIDLSGGGDMFAYEFIPGPGGSRDVLDPANSGGFYAILPWLAAGTTPYDHLYYEGGGNPSAGAAVYLTGVNGLSNAGYTLRDGVYTLLPARYALLPGAFLVRQMRGTTDFLPAQSYRLNDGTLVASGTLATPSGAGYTLDPRSSAFEVAPGSIATTRSEYLETKASAFFANVPAAQLPGDAGRLAIEQAQSLVLGGKLVSQHESGFRGAELDLSIPKLAVVSGNATESGFVSIDVDTLRRLGVSSLLLGGTRQRGDGNLEIDVVSSEVHVATAEASPVTADEILVVANDTINIAKGSSLAAGGEADGRTGPAQYVLKGADGKDDGAFVRVAQAGTPAVVRSNVTRTAGTLVVEADAAIRGNSITLDSTLSSTVRGSLDSGERGALSLGAGLISLGDVELVNQGLTLNRDELAELGSLSQLVLRSYSSIDIYGAGSFGNDKLGITLEAAGIRAFATGAAAGIGTKTQIIGADVALGNLTGASLGGPPVLSDGSTPTAGSGPLELHAATLRLGPVASGHKFELSGFSDATFSAGDVVVQGSGALSVNGSLTIAAARITGETAADYAIAATGAVTTAPSPAQASSLTPGLGARLKLSGSSVTHGGLIDLPAGTLVLEATGAAPGGDVALLEGSVVRTHGVAKTFVDVAAPVPGGTVQLRSAAGDVLLAGSIDASGVNGDEAGTLSVAAPQGTLQVAEGAQLSGGTFEADVGTMAGFGEVNKLLNQGGFADVRRVRVRSGDIVVGQDDVVTAASIRLAADDGSIRLAGGLNASGEKGGSIELYARHGSAAGGGNIMIGEGATLDASASVVATSSAGSLGDGGQILLAITDQNTVADTPARIDVAPGAAIKLSGMGEGAGGSLLMRAPRLSAGGDGVAISRFGAEATGAAEIVVEPFRVYTSSEIVAGVVAGKFDLSVGGLPYTQTKDFVDAFGPAIHARLGDGIHLRPGIEIRGVDSLQLSSDWNLCGGGSDCGSGWRFDGEPIVLTLRAVGDMRLNGGLSDGFSGTSIAAGVLRDVSSATYRLVAGADLNQADALAVQPAAQSGRGTFQLAAGKLVRTGTGNITVAAATDILLKDGASTLYTAGVPTPNPTGFLNIPANVTGASGGGTSSRSPQFPDGGGNVTLTAGRDITAVPSGEFITEWLSRYGQRDSGVLPTNPQTSWFVLFRDFQQGVGTLGGGDVTVTAGGNIQDLSVVAPTTGRLGGSANAAPDLANLTVTGGGDFVVRSGGDIRGGFFLVDDGSGRIRAGGSVTAAATGANGQAPMRPVLALGASSIDVFAAKDLGIQTVVDATALPQLDRLEAGTNNLATFFHRYDAATGVSLRAGSGDIVLYNDQNGVVSANARQFGSQTDAQYTYPGSLRMVAFEGDISVNDAFFVFPVSGGTTELLAGDGITFRSGFEMLKSALSNFPSIVAPTTSYTVGDVRPITPIQADDTEPFRAYALNGSIVASGSRLLLAKPARFYAGQDIQNLSVETRNYRPTDVTRFQAGGEIRFDIPRDPDSGRPLFNSDTIQVEGPGRVELIAGGGVDLGNSIGLVTRGNLGDSTLPEGGASIFVLAGFTGEPRYEAFRDAYLSPGASTARQYQAALIDYTEGLTGTSGLTPDMAWTAFTGLPSDQQQPLLYDVFFDELRSAGRGAAQAGGQTSYDRGYTAIETLFPAASLPKQRQDVNLFFSQLKTEQGGGIDIINPSGLVNAGLATAGEQAKPPSEQGIVTIRGGSIRSMVNGNFLVNQSRVFTLGGGDILIWSSAGDIDAGKGAKTASAAPPPVLIVDENGGVKVDVSGSISGSGIGVLLGQEGIQPGDVDLIAPRGTVNAGDAGIRAAGNLTIAAVRVVGADNIQVGGVSAGVPVAPAAPGAALGGVGNVAAEASKSAERVTQQLASSQAALGEGGLVPSFITVEVIGLGDQ